MQVKRSIRVECRLPPARAVADPASSIFRGLVGGGFFAGANALTNVFGRPPGRSVLQTNQTVGSNIFGYGLKHDGTSSNSIEDVLTALATPSYSLLVVASWTGSGTDELIQLLQAPGSYCAGIRAHSPNGISYRHYDTSGTILNSSVLDAASGAVVVATFDGTTMTLTSDAGEVSTTSGATYWNNDLVVLSSSWTGGAPSVVNGGACWNRALTPMERATLVRNPGLLFPVIGRRGLPVGAGGGSPPAGGSSAFRRVFPRVILNF